MLKFYQARDALQAQMIVDHLAAHRIDAVVLGDYLSGAAGELSAINFPTIWLAEERDQQLATRLLDAFLAPEPDAGGWVCPRCGADVDGELHLCWQCGSARPEDADA